MPCQAPIGGPPLLGCCGVVPPQNIAGRACSVRYEFNEYQTTPEQAWSALIERLNSMTLDDIPINHMKRNIWTYIDNLGWYPEDVYPITLDAVPPSATSPWSTSISARYPTPDPYGISYGAGMKYAIEQPEQFCREVYAHYTYGFIQYRTSCGLAMSNIVHYATNVSSTTQNETHWLFSPGRTDYPECCNEAP